jgi:hypothetical protein
MLYDIRSAFGRPSQLLDDVGDYHSLNACPGGKYFPLGREKRSQTAIAGDIMINLKRSFVRAVEAPPIYHPNGGGLPRVTSMAKLKADKVDYKAEP